MYRLTQRGQTEVVWRCPEEGQRIYQRKDPEVGTGRQQAERKRREGLYGRSEGGLQLVGVREDAEDGARWRQMTGCGHHCRKHYLPYVLHLEHYVICIWFQKLEIATLDSRWIGEVVNQNSHTAILKSSKVKSLKCLYVPDIQIRD